MSVNGQWLMAVSLSHFAPRDFATPLFTCRLIRVSHLCIEANENWLHPGNVFGIDLRNAPHVLAPWLQVVFGQAPAHSFPRDAGVGGKADQFTRQKLKRPARAARGRARTSGRDQERFLRSETKCNTPADLISAG